ncbi:MAG: ribosomal protein L7/L12 [Clostridium sp.]|nr:ribosomal protein L7/L12 [Clostridium sp.]
MPLIKCPMCEKMISPNAVSCPNCGEPIRSNIHKLGLYTLILEDKGSNAIAVIKKIKAVAGADLVTKQFMADDVSSIELLDNLTLERAEVLKKEIEETGAIIRIVHKTKASSDGNTELMSQLNNIPIVENGYLNIISCPNCKSENVHRIDSLSKAGSVALLGVFSIGKIIKTYECDDCGYRW